MTDALVDIRMSAKDAELVSAWQRQQTSIAEFEGSLGRVSKKSTGWTGEMKAGLSENVGGLAKMAVGLFGVEKMVERIIEANSKWYEGLQEIIKKEDELTAKRVESLAGSGKLHDSPEIEHGLHRIAAGTNEQKDALYKGIAETAPGLKAEQQLGLVSELSPLGVIQRDPQKLEETGRIAAVLQKASPKKSEADAANLAWGAKGMAGQHAGELGDKGSVKLLETLQHQGGMSAEESLSFEIEGLEQGLSTKQLQTITSSLSDKNMPLRKPHGMNAREDMAYNRFAREKDAHKRLEMLQHDELTRRGVLGESAAAPMGNMREGVMKQHTAELVGDQKGRGRIFADVSDYQQQHPLEAEEYETDVRIEHQKIAEADNNKIREENLRWKKLDLQRRRQGKTGGFQDLLFGAAEWAGRHLPLGRDIGGEPESPDDIRRGGQAPGSDGVDAGAIPAGARDGYRASNGNLRRVDTRGNLVAQGRSPYVEGRPGDRSIVMPSNGGAPIVNGRAAPERLEGGASQELLEHARKQTAHAEAQTKLLEQVVAKPQSVAVSVETGRGRGMRFDATERAEKSPSAVLGMNH